jgi:uncharacterized protein DUF3592
VSGTIVSSIVKSELSPDNTSSDGVPLAPAQLHSAAIRYRYEFAGKEYDGRRIEFGPTTASSAKTPALVAVASYPAGKAVKVSVSPSRPSLSVLVPGANWGVYAGCALGGILSLIGVGLLIRDRL